MGKNSWKTALTCYGHEDTTRSDYASTADMIRSGIRCFFAFALQ